MNSKKIILWTVTIVAIGIFALPSTVSLFAGQHVWYDLSAGTNDVPCEKCHADVYEEMQSGANGAHRNLTCAMCHRTPFHNTYNPSSGHYEATSNYTYASGEGGGSTPGKEAHAAATIECMDCHGIKLDGGHFKHTEDPEYDSGNENCWKCHGTSPSNAKSRGEWDFISAGGFGFDTTTTDSGKPYPDTGEKAAHLKFVLDAINDTTMKGANEACIACHTHIAVKLNWTHARSLEFDIGLDDPVTDTSTGVHNWNMTGWTHNGTANATVWGNTTGNGSTSYHDNWPGNVDGIYE